MVNQAQTHPHPHTHTYIYIFIYIFIYIYIYTRAHLIIMADSVKFQPVPVPELSAVLYERRFFRSSLTLPNRCALSSVLFF